MEVQIFILKTKMAELMQKLAHLEANVAILNGASTNTNPEIERLGTRGDDLARGNGYDLSIISEDYYGEQAAA